MPTYLDYNATSPVRQQAIDLMMEILAVPANSSSAHSYGRAAKKLLEDARKTIADAISVFPAEVIFTASGTEANTMALYGFPGRKIFVSAVEHGSVLSTFSRREKGGVSLNEGASMREGSHAGTGPHPSPLPKGEGIIPVDSNGIVDLSALDAMLAESSEPALVSVMLANNETGVIQPIAEISAICKKHNALLHSDAVQALGKIEIDFGLLGLDMLTLGAHKSGGPVGAGALVVKQGLEIKPLMVGGKQESGRRAGTSNVAAIAGFGKAVELFDLAHMKKMRGWLDAMESELIAAGGTVFGKDAPRLPNTTSIAMPDVANDVQMMDFDLKGFAVSGGAACSSGKIEASHVLTAMGVDRDTAICAVRISGGWDTTENDIKDFTAAWLQTSGRLAKKQDVA